MLQATGSALWQVTDSWVTHDEFLGNTWLISTQYLTHYVTSDWFTREAFLIPMWPMTHPCEIHESSICVIWLIFIWQTTWCIHIGDMTHPHVTHDSFKCDTRLIFMWYMTHSFATHAYSYVTHDSFIRDTWPFHMWHMTHPRVICHAFIPVI